MRPPLINYQKLQNSELHLVLLHLGAGSADVKDREITVDITENAGCLNVRITNHYNENAQSDIIAAGKGHIHKGLGISIAKNAAEENKGMFEYTAENGIFTAMVVLPVSEKTIG